MKKIFFILLMSFLVIGCSSSNKDTVSYMKAKEMIINNEAILLDVRTEEEYNDNHIDGALLLSLDNIDEKSALDVIGGVDNYVIVYCKSGARSSEAKEKLKSLGYKNVFDLGSIDNWKE